MANKPFEYTIINPLERPTSTDINQLQAQAHYDVRQFAYEIFGRQNGFLGYSFNPEPNSPADGTFYIQQGVAFQYGLAENTFGTPPIPGLVDSYQQKAVTTINRQITAEPVPAGAGEKRYDLLMIRAPASDERLTNSQNVGIYNPTLGTFSVSATSKYKTLTSSLDEFTIESITSVQTPTAPIVYKSGNVFTGAWDPVNKPSVNVGYLGVAYIQRYEGQTAIEAADIEDARTLLTLPTMVGGTSGVLPVSKGGTGNDAAATYTGSVAWFDTAEGKIKYTQAQSAFFPFAAVTGRLLASNASGEPNWIEPRRYYESSPVTQTINNSTGFVEISGFNLLAKSLSTGLVRVRLQPAEGETAANLYGTSDAVFNDNVKLQIRLTGGPTEKTFTFRSDYRYGPNTIPYPAFETYIEGGTYDIAVSVNTGLDVLLNIENVVLFVSQGAY